MERGTFITKLNNKSSTVHPEIFISREWISNKTWSEGDAVIATDQKGTVISMNKLAEELTGWSLDESRGKPIETIFDVINEQTHLPIENPINQAIYDNKLTLLANHTVLIKKDKTQRIIIDSAVPIHNDHAKIIGGVLIFRDVTKQADSQKKLTEKEGLLKGIMENTSLVIYIKDLEGKYLLINRQKEKVYNISADKLLGNDSTGHMSMKQAKVSMTSDMQAIKENRLIEFEQIIKHPDGTLHNYHTSKFPLYDNENNIYAVCAISTDISESKKNIEMKEKLALQDILLKSDIQYDELTKNMPNMFFSLDRSLHHTSFNHACEHFTGLKAGDVIGKTIEEVYPAGAPLFLTEYKEVLKTGKAQTFIYTFTIDENPFTYIANIYPTEKGISILMTDLTRQKKSDMDMLELVERLQEKNKDLRQFAYTVSHDLRAPITRVLSLVSLFNSDPNLKINNRGILEIVAKEITNIGNVVKDMDSSISVRDEAKQKEFITFDSELILIKKVLENELIESNATIYADFQDPEGIVTVKSYLYSIMYNLLSNAIKYRSPDIPLVIHLHTRQNDEFICLTIKDNGLGMDLKKNGDKIFGLYNRFHSKKIEGKGIGLNLVKTHAESLGGTVEVDSKVDHGSIFKIFFPVTKNQHKVT